MRFKGVCFLIILIVCGNAEENATGVVDHEDQTFNSTELVDNNGPNRLSAEQLQRFRKFLSSKGFQIKNEDLEAMDEKRPQKFQRNIVSETIREKYPERLSDVTAEDILPLLPRNLSDLMPVVRELKNERCQRHVKYFLQELHHLKKWAVQSKSFK